ncbi:MAG: hypothetical protein KDH16_15685 [Rhodocyclaceae bacterium]|nr:hypothetical protein [Rhodocyclaceae bacterium]
MTENNDSRYFKRIERQRVLVELIRQGLDVQEALADPRVGVSYSAYRKWRERDHAFAALVDTTRAIDSRKARPADLTSAEFAHRYFGRVRTPFQQLAIDKMERCPPGNIVLMLWPPEYGKTTTSEDYFTEKIARHPASYRITVASESDSISKKIVTRVRRRLEIPGPFPGLVTDWGPFRPDGARAGTPNYPWNEQHFTVRQRESTDERDHTMLAIGWRGSTVSIRTDHLHIDDVQSLKTYAATAKQLSWFRQDALTRPGESGITTIAGTRVGEDDFYEALEEDPELDGILEVVRFPAIQIDPVTGEQVPLWPEKHNLEQLDRIRRKIKDEAFDRSYLMKPGASRKHRAFTEAGKAAAIHRQRRINNLRWVPEDHRPPAVLSLDPGLRPGITVLSGWVMYPDSLELGYMEQSEECDRNEDIIAIIERMIVAMNRHVRCSKLIIEAANFQRGLARDERLNKLLHKHGMTAREHSTNANKYDPNIGIATMAGDWEAGKIRIPYDTEDRPTKAQMDDLLLQCRNWKPLVRGTAAKMDRLMSMWFAWIWWTETKHRLEVKPQTWQRQGIPYATSSAPQLIIPIGVHL